MTRPAAQLSATKVAQMIEHTEALAYAHQLYAASQDWTCRAERTEDGGFLSAPSLDILLFNRLVGWGVDAPVRRQQLHAALGRYRDAGLTHYGVQLSPDAEPLQLPRWLEESGFSRADNWTKVYRAAGDVPAGSTALRGG